MINRVVLVGRLTRDIDLRKTPSGLSVARFTLACNRVMSSNSRNNANENTQTADFISCVAWRQSADYLSSYASKGSIVGVEGRITTGSYDDNTGRKVYTTEVTCDRVSLIGGRNNDAQQSNSNYQSNINYSMNNNFNNNNNYNNSNNYGNSFDTNNSFANNNGSNDMNDFDNGPILDISSDDLPF